MLFRLILKLLTRFIFQIIFERNAKGFVIVFLLFKNEISQDYF